MKKRLCHFHLFSRMLNCPMSRCRCLQSTLCPSARNLYVLCGSMEACSKSLISPLRIMWPPHMWAGKGGLVVWEGRWLSQILTRVPLVFSLDTKSICTPVWIVAGGARELSCRTGPTSSSPPCAVIVCSFTHRND